MRKYFAIKDQELTLRQQLEGIPLPIKVVEGAINFIKLYARFCSQPEKKLGDDWRFGYYRNITTNTPTLDEMRMIDPAFKRVHSMNDHSGWATPNLIKTLHKYHLTEFVAIRLLANDISRLAEALTTKAGTWETMSGESIFNNLDVARQRSLIVLAHFVGVENIFDARILVPMGVSDYKASAVIIRKLGIKYFPYYSSWHDVIINLVAEDIQYGDSDKRPREYSCM